MAETSNLTLASEEDFKLFNLTDVDRATLRQTDEEYVPHDWQELKTIVGNGLSPSLFPWPSAVTFYANCFPLQNLGQTCH